MTDTLPRNTADWPAEWLYRYNERAGIKEYDGQSTRAEAEREAERECRRQFRAMKKAGVTL